jgi:hypothetical protein
MAKHFKKYLVGVVAVLLAFSSICAFTNSQKVNAYSKITTYSGVGIETDDNWNISFGFKKGWHQVSLAWSGGGVDDSLHMSFVRYYLQHGSSGYDKYFLPLYKIKTNSGSKVVNFYAPNDDWYNINFSGGGYRGINTIKWTMSAKENLNSCSSVSAKCSPSQAWAYFKKKISIKKKKTSLTIATNKFSKLWKNFDINSMYLHSLYFKKGKKKVLIKIGNDKYFKTRYKKAYALKHKFTNYMYLKLNKSKIKKYASKINAKKGNKITVYFTYAFYKITNSNGKNFKYKLKYKLGV